MAENLVKLRGNKHLGYPLTSRSKSLSTESSCFSAFWVLGTHNAMFIFNSNFNEAKKGFFDHKPYL